MALRAQLAIGLDQQTLGIRAVRVVACQALAVLDGLMLALGGLGERIVALRTQGRRELHQQVCVIGLMGIMAGGAFAVLHRLVFDLGGCQSVLVARETDRGSLAWHSL